MNAIEAICIAGIGVSAAGTLILFTRRPIRTTVVSLGLLIAMMGLFLTAVLALTSRWKTMVLVVPYTILPLGWFAGPLILSHIQLSLFTVHWKRLARKYRFALIPVALDVARAVVNPFIWPEYHDPEKVFAHQGIIGLQTRIAWAIFWLWTGAFILAGIRTLRSYGAGWRERYSTRKSNDPRTLWILTLSLLAWVLLVGVQPPMTIFFPDYGPIPAISLLTIPTVLILYLILHQIFNEDRAPRIASRTGPGLGPGRAKSPRLSNERQAELADALEKLLEGDRHLDESLRIADLAGELSVSVHHLSEVINQRFGTNFYGLVNRYRVRTVSRLLADPARGEESILDLAFEAGFNAKASFNRIFKAETGQTPSAYRREKLGSKSQTSV